MKYIFVNSLQVTKEVFTSYLKAVPIIALILCILYSIGLSLIGIKFAIVIGIMIGILSIIPYAGAISGFIVSIVVALIQFKDIQHILLVILVFAVVQLLETLVITPKVLGRSMGLNPIITMILLFIAGFAFGPLGMVLTVPIAAIVYKVYKGRLNESIEAPNQKGRKATDIKAVNSETTNIEVIDIKSEDTNSDKI